jgi:hypothetical protein
MIVKELNLNEPASQIFVLYRSIGLHNLNMVVDDAISVALSISSGNASYFTKFDGYVTFGNCDRTEKVCG